MKAIFAQQAANQSATRLIAEDPFASSHLFLATVYAGGQTRIEGKSLFSKGSADRPYISVKVARELHRKR